jgi:hypothetical protein
MWTNRCRRHFSIYAAPWPTRVGPHFDIHAPSRSRESSPERVKSKEKAKEQEREERERKERKEAAKIRRSLSASPRPHKRRRKDVDVGSGSLGSREWRKARRREKERRHDEAEESEAEVEEVLKNQARERRRKKKLKSRIREPKLELLPPPPKLITLQPSPAQFAARQLRSGIMVLAEEVSDEEHIEELEPMVPEDSGTSSGSDSDSDTDTSPEDEARQLEVHIPVQSFIRRKFGLWKPGNPQSFASQRRLLDPQADLGPDPFISLSSFRRSKRTPSPPITILDSDEEERRVTPRRATNKSVASASKTPTKSWRSTREPASEPVPLIKTRKAGATYTNSPRSLVQRADDKRNLRSRRTLSLREAAEEDLDELHFVKIRPLRFPEPVVAIPGPADIWKNLDRKINADRRLSRPIGTEEMTISDDGVEERWKVEESQQSPFSSPDSPGSPTTLRLRSRPERRLLEVPTFGVLSPLESTGLAISTSTEVLAAGGSPVARKAIARMKGREVCA